MKKANRICKVELEHGRDDRCPVVRVTRKPRRGKREEREYRRTTECSRRRVATIMEQAGEKNGLAVMAMYDELWMAAIL